MVEVLFEIFYEVQASSGWTLAVVLVIGLGTPSMVSFVLRMARWRIKQDWPELDPDCVRGRIIAGNEN